MTFHHDTGGLCRMLNAAYDAIPLTLGALVAYSPDLAEWDRIGEEK